MSETTFLNFNFGKKATLMIKMSLTCSLLTLLSALLCLYVFQIKGIIFYALLIYSIINCLNIALFLRYKRLELTYNIMSVLAFLVTYITCLYSGGINSPFTSFFVLIIFSGYTSNLFYGDLWLAIIFIALTSLFLINVSDYTFPNYINEQMKEGFHFFFVMFFIILFGGVYGRLMSKSTHLIHKSKQEITRKNEEKTVMLKEIHHRVKNNLQVVNSLLRIQSRGVTDENVKLMFKLIQSRVVAMARLHEKIYNTKDMRSIDVKTHFKVLVRDLIHSYNLDNNVVSKFSIAPVKMSIDTLLPLSLIVNELVINSLKKDCNVQQKKQIEIQLKPTNDGQYELRVIDNCINVHNSILSELTNTSGAQLVKTFVRQLNGRIEDFSKKTGAHYKISFS